jgi:hypothetical protein
MFLAYGHFDRVPLSFVAAYLAAACFFGWAHLSSAFERKELKNHANLAHDVVSAHRRITK